MVGIWLGERGANFQNVGLGRPVAVRAQSVHRPVLLDGRTGWGLGEEVVCIARPQTAGKRVFVVERGAVLTTAASAPGRPSRAATGAALHSVNPMALRLGGT